MPILQAMKQFHRDLQARAARHFGTQEIIRVMEPMHAAELAQTPGEQWRHEGKGFVCHLYGSVM